MSGRHQWELGAQLALMDAAIFFAVAILISSMMFYYSARIGTSPAQNHDQDNEDPGEILRVFMRASIGSNMEFEGSERVLVDECSEVSECLSIEIMALSKGSNLSAFEELNRVLGSILESMCTPVYEPCLVVYEMGRGVIVRLLSIPGQQTHSLNAYASSVELAGADGRVYIVELVLSPSALPELLQV